MTRTAWMLVLVAACCTAVGCSQSDEPAQTGGQGDTPSVAASNDSASSGAVGDATVVAPPDNTQWQAAQDTSSFTPSPAVADNTPLPQISADASPEEVVSLFLKSLCTGDEVMTAGLLTDLARQETANHGLTIQPIGSPQATYQVQQAQYLANQPDGAHVNSIWTETDHNGNKIEFDAIWALRRQDNGWRIAGMATQIQPGQPPQFFNFEQPETLLRQLEQSQADSTASSPASQPPTQAQRPAQPGSAPSIQR